MNDQGLVVRRTDVIDALPGRQLRVLDQVRRYSTSCTGYFHLQPGLRHVFHEGGGLTSYEENRSWPAVFGLSPLRYVLGEPLVDPARMEDTLREVIDRLKRPTFLPTW